MSSLKTWVLWVSVFMVLLILGASPAILSKKQPVSVNSGKTIFIDRQSSSGVIPVLNSASFEVRIVGGYTSCSCVASFPYPLRLKPNEITEIPIKIGDTVLEDFHARWFLDHPEQFELNVHIVRKSNNKEHK